MLRKLLKIILGLLFLLAVMIGLLSINHPIILKWVAGTAKHHGGAIPATAYVNGQVSSQVKIFYADEPSAYLLSLQEFEGMGSLQFLSINMKEKWIRTPESTSKKDYDIIAGHLFQSETGARFTPFQDDIKGFNFDPRLTSAGKQFAFLLPPGRSVIDSIRIILP